MIPLAAVSDAEVTRGPSSMWRELAEARGGACVCVEPGLYHTSMVLEVCVDLTSEQMTSRYWNERERVWKAENKKISPPFSKAMVPNSYRSAHSCRLPGKPRRGIDRLTALGRKVVVSQRQFELSERKSFHANLISCFDELHQNSRLGECPRKCVLLSVSI